MLNDENDITTNQQENPPPHNERSHQRRAAYHQYYTVFTGYVTLFCSGIAAGWVIALRPILTARTNPLHSLPYISGSQYAWATSILYIGGLFGILVWNILADKCGRKVNGRLIGLTQTIGWIGVTFADCCQQILIARFILGIGASGAILNSVLYINETVSAKRKGPMLALVWTMLSFGFCFVFILPSVLSYRSINILCVVLSISHMLLFRSLPETPLYFLLQGNAEKAKRSMRWYRGNESEATKEVLYMENQLEANSKYRNRATYQELVCTGYVSNLLILTVMLMGHQLCGIGYMLMISNVLTTNVLGIFLEIYAQVMTNLHLVVGAIIISAVHRICKKVTLLVSYAIAFFSFMCMFVVIKLLVEEQIEHTAFITFLIVVDLLLFFAFHSLGIGPIPFVLYSKMLPSHLLSNGLSIGLVFSLLTSYSLNEIILSHNAIIEDPNFSVIFAIANFITFAMILKFVPSKTIHQVEVHYNSATNDVNIIT